MQKEFGGSGDPWRWGTNILHLLPLPNSLASAECLPALQLSVRGTSDICLEDQTLPRELATCEVGINWGAQGYLQSQRQVTWDLTTAPTAPSTGVS